MRSDSMFTVDATGITIKSLQAVKNADAPKMLYHYTNLSSLALILKNKTLRLMPLSKMDDKQEKETSDIDNLGRFFFVSCWTDDGVESIPMWKMYASLESGVRIGLPPNPFAWELVTTQYLCDGVGFPLDPNQRGQLVKSLIHSCDLERGLFCTEMGFDSILHKVEYTDDHDRLVPVVAPQEDTIHFGEYGLVKHTGWDFQHEWRYLLRLFPPRTKDDPHDLGSRLQELFPKMRSGELGEPCKHYDLTLDPVAISQMEIIPSPEMSPGNRVLFDLLIKEYCPTATVKESALTETL